MPPKRRHVVIDEDISVAEELLVKRRRKDVRKDPVKVARGKAQWAALSEEEKARRIEILRQGRLKHQADPTKKTRQLLEHRYVRKGIHTDLLRRNITKKEARVLIADLHRDLGTTKRIKRSYVTSSKPRLPPLSNPLPQFFAKHIKTIARVLAVPLKSQINIIKNTVPIAQALGIIPPGSTAFTLLFRALS